MFGVDVNPMAVQLARLSLWLATLASDKHSPFSTIAWSPGIVSSEPVSTTCGVSRHAATGDIGAASLPLFTDSNSGPHWSTPTHAPAAGPSARRLAGGRRGKGRTLATLHAPESRFGRWSAMLDLWCAGWFWEDGRPPSTAFGELCDRLLHQPAALPDRLTQRFLDHASTLASRPLLPLVVGLP